MPLFGRTAPDENIQAAPGPAQGLPSALVSSAAKVQLDNPSWNFWRFRDETWQRELWRLYDIIPEFYSSVNWVGSCMSRIRIYVADVDELGRVQGETEDENIQALADTIFGGPAGKSEALRLLGINITVTGEAYILGRPTANKDQWLVLSSSEIRNRGGELWWGDMKNPIRLDNTRDLLIRVWSPHPRMIWRADCPSRACQPVLRELEQLTKYVFSQIDSRLIGAGLLIMPKDLDFPADQFDSASDSLMTRLAQAGQASMKGEGTAAGVLPVMVESPADQIEGWSFMSFASELSKQALELRAEAIRRLGMGMNMPPEVLTGTGDTNHWSAWHIEESGIKIHIEPLATRICDGLATSYLTPALKLMGKDPSKYTFWYDTTPLTVRPQRLTDALNVYEKGGISLEALREEGYFSESQAPTEEERIKRYLVDLTLRDPSLFALQGVRELIGITEKMLPPELATPPPPPPVPATGIQPTGPAAIPERTTETDPSLQASGVPDRHGLARHDLALLVAADATARRALEMASSRLLARGSQRAQYLDVPRHELHTKIAEGLPPAEIARVLENAFTQIPALCSHLGADVDVAQFEKFMASYCATRLVQATPHDPEVMRAMLIRDGLIDGR